MKRIVALMVTSFVFIYGCDRSVAQSVPTPGVYVCKSVYRDQGYSFALYNNGTYRNLTKRITNKYSYAEDEDGITTIKWQGINQSFDMSFYWEREDGEKFIVLGGKPNNSQVCTLQIN